MIMIMVVITPLKGSCQLKLFYNSLNCNEEATEIKSEKKQLMLNRAAHHSLTNA